MRAFLLFLGLVAVALVPVPSADGCAIPWRLNQPVTVSSEDALIVWDPATKTEHFVRRANFQTDAKDFGFLVPTPTPPELAEANDSIFELLSAATAPRIVYEKRKQTIYRNAGVATGAAMAPKSAAVPPPTVQVLDRKKVAGYDAVVLKANDPKALRDWLDKHGYDARKELVEWFKWYTDHEWVITAFKLSKDGSLANQLTGRTVRMTFKTETPFYPYREPADMRPKDATGQRVLKVFFLSDKRYAGTIGQEAAWPGAAAWANAAPAGTVGGVFGNLGLEPKAKDEHTAKAWHLTEFEDKSFPRPGTDEVYFKAAATQDALEKPPVVVPVYEYEYVDGPVPGSPEPAARFAFPILLGVIAAVVGVICLVGWMLLKK